MVKLKIKLLIIGTLFLGLFVLFTGYFFLLKENKILADDIKTISEITITSTLDMGEITEQASEATYFATTGELTLSTEGVHVVATNCFFGGDNNETIVTIIIRPNDGYMLSEECELIDQSTVIKNTAYMVMSRNASFGRISLKKGDMYIYYTVGYALVYRNELEDDFVDYYEYYKKGEEVTIKENPGDFRNDDYTQIITKWTDKYEEYNIGDKITINETSIVYPIWGEGAQPITKIEFSSEPTDFMITKATEENPKTITVNQPFALKTGQENILLVDTVCFEMDGICAYAIVRAPYGYYISPGVEIVGIEEGPQYGPIYVDSFTLAMFGEQISCMKHGDYMIGSKLGFMLTYDANLNSEYVGDYLIDGYYKKNDLVIVKGEQFSSNNPEYYFGGWNTEPDGTGVTYLPGQSYEMDMEDTKLYAIWTNEEFQNEGTLFGNCYLSNDVILTQNIYIPHGEYLFINLNGHTINFNSYCFNNEGILCIYNPSENGINALFITLTYEDPEFESYSYGVINITGTVYPNENLMIETEWDDSCSYLKYFKAFKTEDSSVNVEMNGYELITPTFDYTVEAYFDICNEITEIPVLTPNGYEISPDGITTIDGVFSLDGEVEGIKVLASVQDFASGINSVLAIRLLPGYIFNEELEFTGDINGRIEFIPVKNKKMIPVYKQMFNIEDLEVGDYLIICRLGYTIVYMSGVKDLEYKIFTYEEYDEVTIKDNEFGFEKEGYYFAGWSYYLDDTKCYYYPGQVIEMSDEDIELIAEWTNTPLPTEGFLNGSYVLFEDTILTGNLVISIGKYVSINLNGHVININNQKYNIECNGKLYIFDNVKDINHYYTYNKQGKWEYIQNPSEIEKANSITYEDIDDETISGSVIKVPGGSITNGQNGAIYIYGECYAKGINIIGNQIENYGGAISFNNGGANISNTTILGNCAEYGGGVYTCSYYTCYLIDTVIMYNAATEGGGVFSIFSAPTLDGKTIILNNYASECGQNYGQNGNTFFTVNETFNGIVVFYADDFSTYIVAQAYSEENIEYFKIVNKEGSNYTIIARYNDYNKCYYLIQQMYTITFIVQGDDVPPETQYVVQGEIFVEPEFTSERKGFEFVGWSYYEDYYAEIYFGEQIYNDWILYAYYRLKYTSPTAENPEIIFDEVPEDVKITYNWYMITDDGWYYLLENETTNKLTRNYGIGTFACNIYVDGRYDSETDSFSYSEFNVSDDEEKGQVNVTTVENANISYQWFYWNKGALHKYSIKEYDDIYMYYLEYDEEAKIWNAFGSDQQRDSVGFYNFFYAGEKLIVKMNSSNAEYYNLYIMNNTSQEEDDIIVEANGDYTFTYTFKSMGYYNVELYAYIGDYDEYCDYSAVIDVEAYDWELEKLEGETNNILSNYTNRLGYYKCLIYTNNIECFDVDFTCVDRVKKQPTNENNYTFDVEVDGEILEYKWFAYSQEELEITPDQEFVSTEYSKAEYNEETKSWIMSEENAAESYSNNKVFTLYVSKGDIITMHIKTNEDCYIRVKSDVVGFIYVSSELSREAVFTYVVKYDSETDIYIDAYNMDEINNWYFHYFELKAEISKKYYDELPTQNTNKLVDVDDGLYVAKAYTYRGVLESEPIEYCNHNYETPTYNWNEDGSECIASAKCDKCEFVLNEKATISTKIIQERTKDQEEITLYTAAFTNDVFTTQTFEVKTGEKLQVIEIKLLSDKSGTVLSTKNMLELDSFEALYDASVLPSKKGYSFAGWYYEEGGIEYRINLDSKVVKAITIYAKWEKIDISKFATLVESISTKQGEARFSAISEAINEYNNLTEEEKKEAEEKNLLLKEFIAEYNKTVQVVNNDHKAVTNNLLLVMVAVFPSLCALISVLKRKLF